MPIYAQDKGGNFRPAPEGQHQAVCCDIVDMGLQDTGFGGGKKPKVQVRWEVEAIDEEAKPEPRPFLVVATYTNSLHPKSSLRPDLVSWRGREFTDKELEGKDGRGFDLERLLGANCILQVVHKPTRKGGMFGKIAAIMGLKKGVAKIEVSEHYVRVRDREEVDEEQTADADADIPADDDAPF